MSEDVVVIGGARTPFCEWLGGKRGDGEVGGRLADVSAEEPVSYTHLTLPTILLV